MLTGMIVREARSTRSDNNFWSTDNLRSDNKNSQNWAAGVTLGRHSALKMLDHRLPFLKVNAALRVNCVRQRRSFNG